DHRQDNGARDRGRAEGCLARRDLRVERAAGRSRGGLDAARPLSASGRPAERGVGSGALPVLRYTYSRPAGARRGLCTAAAADRPPGVCGLSRSVRRHVHDAHGGPGAPVLPRLRWGHAGRVVATHRHKLRVRPGLRAARRRGLPGRRPAARGGHPARRRGPDRRVRAPDRDRGRPYRRPHAFRRGPRLAGVRTVERREGHADTPV
ncbi:MAG: hypothetical protein AVDCRST_MAG01-01-692, partial [uncultured Rubrobacteraceae bacterium]